MKIESRNGELNFRWVSCYVLHGKIVLDGYHTANSTESKASVELDFHEAGRLIEQLKKLRAEMPCPDCGRT